MMLLGLAVFWSAILMVLLMALLYKILPWILIGMAFNIIYLFNKKKIKDAIILTILTLIFLSLFLFICYFPEDEESQEILIFEMWPFSVFFINLIFYLFMRKHFLANLVLWSISILFILFVGSALVN